MEVRLDFLEFKPCALRQRDKTRLGGMGVLNRIAPLSRLPSRNGDPRHTG